VGSRLFNVFSRRRKFITAFFALNQARPQFLFQLSHPPGDGGVLYPEFSGATTDGSGAGYGQENP
jgi:hypothetical protein